MSAVFGGSKARGGFEQEDVDDDDETVDDFDDLLGCINDASAHSEDGDSGLSGEAVDGNGELGALISACYRRASMLTPRQRLSQCRPGMKPPPIRTTLVAHMELNRLHRPSPLRILLL